MIAKKGQLHSIRSIDPVEQKQFQSTLARVQFAVYWIRFDMSYPAAQLARFCASESTGPSHWAALTHLIGYLICRSSHKIMYWRGADGSLDGYADSDWGNTVSRNSTTGRVARYNRPG